MINVDSRLFSRTLWLICAAAGLAGTIALGLVPRSGRTASPLRLRESSPHALRLLSWNIGKMHLGWDSRAADADLPHVARVIASYRPDVVALQELRDAGQLRRLLPLLEGQYVGQAAHDEAYDRRVAILVRTGALTRDRPVSFETLTTSSGRAALAARLQPAPGLDVAVLSIHVDAFDAGRRREQLQEILGWARQRLDAADVFVTGDFNLHLGGPAATATTARSVGAGPDRPSGLPRVAEDARLYHLVTRHYADLGPSEATSILGVRLDYLFGRAPHLGRSAVWVPSGERINFMDHDPVVADLELRPSRAVALRLLRNQRREREQDRHRAALPPEFVHTRR